MTIAPELPGAAAVIAEAVEAGVAVALGHSDATYDEARRAFALGVAARHPLLQRHASLSSARARLRRRRPDVRRTSPASSSPTASTSTRPRWRCCCVSKASTRLSSSPTAFRWPVSATASSSLAGRAGRSEGRHRAARRRHARRQRDAPRRDGAKRRRLARRDRSPTRSAWPRSNPASVIGVGGSEGQGRARLRRRPRRAVAGAAKWR